MSVVRATAVRGHLRFWWRAVRGWRAGGSLERLWELESALFGSAGEGGASPLSVEVEVLREGEKVGIAQYGRAVQWYLGFPLRGDKEWAPVKEGVAFRLRLRFPEKVGELNFWEELEAALWAWETFGGIGARTRRGFGALLPQGAGVPGEEEIREKLRQYGQKAGWPEGVPHLTPKSFVRVVPLSWRELAERYQAFRQARPGGTPEARAAPTGPSPTGCGASRGGTPPTTCPGTPCTSSPGPTSACPSSSTSRTGATPRHHPPAQGGRPPGEPPPLPPAWGRAEALRGGGPRRGPGSLGKSLFWRAKTAALGTWTPGSPPRRPKRSRCWGVRWTPSWPS